MGDAEVPYWSFLATPLYQNRAWFGLVKTMLMQYAITTAVILWMMVVVSQTTGNRTGQTATKKGQKTNKTWIRMRIRDYLNGLMNTIDQLGDEKWDDVGKYTVSNQSKDLKATTSYWFNAITVLNAMRAQWVNICTLNGWVDATSSSVISDIDAMLNQLTERTMTAKDLKAMTDAKADIDAQIKALMDAKALIESGQMDNGDAPK